MTVMVGSGGGDATGVDGRGFVSGDDAPLRGESGKATLFAPSLARGL